MKTKSITFYSKDNQSYSGSAYCKATLGSKWQIKINLDTGNISETLLEINTIPSKCNREKVTEFIRKVRGY